jgi:predicted ABC-type ATPase
LLIDTLTSFVLETTLSGHTALQTMLHAREAGFTVDLLYVCLSSVGGHRARVVARVAQGGHDVPEQDVRRRYARSLANLPRALALSDHALIFDNSSTDGYQLLLEWADGHAISHAPTLPHWLQDHLGDLLRQMPESR